MTDINHLVFHLLLHQALDGEMHSVCDRGNRRKHHSKGLKELCGLFYEKIRITSIVREQKCGEAENEEELRKKMNQTITKRCEQLWEIDTQRQGERKWKMTRD